MNVLQLHTPAGLTETSELPIAEYPDIPLWTENYCFVCFDPETEMGVWTHLGRAPFDPTLWRELSVVYLPSGERLVNKGYGRGETDRGPGGATMAFQCIEPWNLWQTTRDGGSVRTTVSELTNGMVTDRAHERVGFDFQWRPVSPVWDWGEVEDEHQWGKAHYEQLCDVQGEIRIGGTTHDFSGIGLRDHTMGPRDFTVFSSHIWSWAAFPSGRGFILLQLVVDGKRVERAAIVEDGRLSPAQLHNSPVIAGRDEAADSYVLELDDHRIAAEVVHVLPNGFAGPNDICIGYDPAITGTANYECCSRFEWDGEVGYGWTERSLRLA